MRWVFLVIMAIIFTAGCSTTPDTTEPARIEISCCDSCISHYNESNGPLCSDQDYSDGDIEMRCWLEFQTEREKYTIDYCRNLVE